MTCYRKQMELNPDLEALRAKALQEIASDNSDWVVQLIKKTASIHAGFLFEDLKTLQKLCLYIGETQNKITDSGWESFGYHLGLSPTLLKVINHNNFTKEDPCYNIFLAYVQHENASIGKILKSLYEMGRLDVLWRIKHSINALADLIIQCNPKQTNNNITEDTSDYESLPTSEGCSQSSEGNINISLGDVFIRPKIIPPAPLIFQNIQDSPEMTSQKIQQALNEGEATQDSYKEGPNEVPEKMCDKMVYNENFTSVREVQILNKSSHHHLPSGVNNHKRENFKSPRKKKYGMKVLLTFAEDGEKFAEEIARKFRKRIPNQPTIGVLILGEHGERVSLDPLQFIEGAFHQVDYVCPIITPGYYKLITKQEKVNTLMYNHVDASYVSYIYRLMNSHFIMNNCLNDKIRCIIPESTFSSVPFHFLLTNPIFGAWVNYSEVDDMALRLLKNFRQDDFDDDILEKPQKCSKGII